MRTALHKPGHRLASRPTSSLRPTFQRTGRQALVCRAVIQQPPRHQRPPQDDGGWEDDVVRVISKKGGIPIPELEDLTKGEADSLASLRNKSVQEYDYHMTDDQVSGQLPDELHEGTVLLSGPGLYTRFGHTARSIEDADGMVASLALKEGKPVFFRNRMVRTDLFRMEQAVGRRLSRGFHDASLLTGSSPLDGWFSNPLDLTFPGRTGANVLHWAGHLYALSEHASPWELRPHTLEAVKIAPLGHAAKGARATPPALVARYHIVPEPCNTQGEEDREGEGAVGRGWLEGESARGQRLVLMRTAQVGLDTLVSFTELNEAGQVVNTQETRLENTVSRMVLDFAVTDTRIAVLAPPVSFNLGRFLTQSIRGQCSFAECMDWDPSRPARLHILPRTPTQGAGGARASQSSQGPGVAVVQVPGLCMTSCVNAYDIPGTPFTRPRMVVDMVATQGLPYINTTTQMTGSHMGQVKPELTRMEVELGGSSEASGQAWLTHAGVVSHRSTAHMAVSPHMATHKHTHVYATASGHDDPQHWGPAQVVMKLVIDEQRGTGSRSSVWSPPGSGHILGPLTLVPKRGARQEGDAWILTTKHATEGSQPASTLLVLDAGDVAAGPVCEIELPGLLPGTSIVWSDTYLGPTSLKKGWAPLA